MSPFLYFINIYRSDDAILVNRCRRKRQTGAAFWFMSAVLIICLLILLLANVWAGVGIMLLFGGMLVLAQLNEVFEKSFLFEKGEILVETVHPFNRKSVKRHARQEDLSILPSRDINKGRFYYRAIITNNGKEFTIGTRSFEEAEWIADTLQEYFVETPEQDHVDPENYRDNEAETAATESSKSLFYRGRNFRRIPTPAERADTESDSPEQGVLRIRCGFCQHLVPKPFIFADTARCACPNCRTLFETPSLKREPFSKWRRFRFKQDDENFEVTERLFGWAPSLWIGVFVVSAYLGVIALGMLAMIFNAKRTLTPEQFDELWQGVSLGNHPAALSYFTFFWLAVVLGVLTILIALWMLMVRRGIRITPTECIMTRYLFFYPMRTTISRYDVRRIIVPGNSPLGYFIHRKGRFYFSDMSRLQGIVHHFLLTHPPLERRPFDANDETREFSTLGGIKTDCLKFRYHDTETGNALPFEEALDRLRNDDLDNTHVVYYSSASLQGVGFSRHFDFENSEQELRFGVPAVTDRKIRALKVLESYIFFFIFGIYLSLPIGMSVWNIVVGKGRWFPLIVCFCALLILITFSLFLHWDTLKKLDSEWMLSLTKDRLELKRKFRDWQDCRTISRSDILYAEMNTIPQRETSSAKIPGDLRDGRASIRLRNGESVGIPQIPEFRSNEAMQSLVNELNEFLQHSLR